MEHSLQMNESAERWGPLWGARVEALAPYRSDDGTYLLRNELRHLVATAPDHD
jgi:hypothetical protein